MYLAKVFNYIKEIEPILLEEGFSAEDIANTVDYISDNLNNDSVYPWVCSYEELESKEINKVNKILRERFDCKDEEKVYFWISW